MSPALWPPSPFNIQHNRSVSWYSCTSPKHRWTVERRVKPKLGQRKWPGRKYQYTPLFFLLSGSSNISWPAGISNGFIITLASPIAQSNRWSDPFLLAPTNNFFPRLPVRSATWIYKEKYGKITRRICLKKWNVLEWCRHMVRRRIPSNSIIDSLEHHVVRHSPRTWVDEPSPPPMRNWICYCIGTLGCRGCGGSRIDQSCR